MTLAILWEAVVIQVASPGLWGEMVWATMHYVRDTFASMATCKLMAQIYAEPGSIRICEMWGGG